MRCCHCHCHCGGERKAKRQRQRRWSGVWTCGAAQRLLPLRCVVTGVCCLRRGCERCCDCHFCARQSQSAAERRQWQRQMQAPGAWRAAQRADWCEPSARRAMRSPNLHLHLHLQQKTEQRRCRNGRWRAGAAHERRWALLIEHRIARKRGVFRAAPKGGETEPTYDLHICAALHGWWEAALLWLRLRLWLWLPLVVGGQHQHMRRAATPLPPAVTACVAVCQRRTASLRTDWGPNQRAAVWCRICCADLWAHPLQRLSGDRPVHFRLTERPPPLHRRHHRHHHIQCRRRRGGEGSGCGEPGVGGGQRWT